MATPLVSPSASHLASLGASISTEGKNMFKLVTSLKPIVIIQTEFQIRDQNGNHYGGYVYMSEVSFIQNGTDYEYSVPVSADPPDPNYAINPNKQIRFRHWVNDLNVLASEWSNYLSFHNAPLKPEFAHSFVLYRNQDNADDDFLIAELSESSKTAHTNPNNEDGVDLANGPVKYLAVYGYQDLTGNEVWKTTPLLQPSNDGSIRVELGDDVLPGSQVDVSAFAVYEFYHLGEGPFYTLSEISDMMPSLPPDVSDLEPSLNPFKYVINVLSTSEGPSTSEEPSTSDTSSLYDVGSKMVELTWAPPNTQLITQVSHYEIQARVVADGNLFVPNIVNAIDTNSRGYRLSEATVVAALQTAGQLPAGVSPSYGSKIEYMVVANYPDTDAPGVSQQVTIGQLSDALPSSAISVSSHFAKTTNEVVFAATYDISAILDNLGPQVSNAAAIQTQVVRKPINGDLPEVLTTDRIDLNLPQTLYRQRVVYDIGSNVSLLENITENDFELVAWVVNNITSFGDIYLDNTLVPSNVLSPNVPEGWNEVTKSTTLSSKGRIFNVTVDNENKLFNFIALHRDPLQNVVVVQSGVQGELVQGKPLTAEGFIVERVETDNLYLESNAPQELLDLMEHPYPGSFVTRVEGKFSDIFDMDGVPSSFMVAFCDGDRLTTEFVNNGVFAGLTLAEEVLNIWKNGL